MPKHGAEPAAAGDLVAEGPAADDRLQAEAAEAEQSEDVPVQKFMKKFIQTFVFSATLTLPSSLRERLRKGTLNLAAVQGVAAAEAHVGQLPPATTGVQCT